MAAAASVPQLCITMIGEYHLHTTSCTLTQIQKYLHVLGGYIEQDIDI